MRPPISSGYQLWSFSLMLGVVYIALFHLWLVVPRDWIVSSGVVATLALAAGLLAKRKYFLNRWDLIFHGLVIADIFLEAILIPVHDHYGFYFCATGFAVVVGGYRAQLIRAKAD